MPSLVESIVALENEADNLIAESRTRAKDIRDRANAEMVKYGEDLARSRDERLAAFENDAQARCDEALKRAEQELSEHLKAVDQVPDQLMGAQVERILARFREW